MEVMGVFGILFWLIIVFEIGSGLCIFFGL